MLLLHATDCSLQSETLLELAPEGRFVDAEQFSRLLAVAVSMCQYLLDIAMLKFFQAWPVTDIRLCALPACFNFLTQRLNCNGIMVGQGDMSLNNVF